MSLFCLLWTPLFYLFWRSITGSFSLIAGFIAVFLGCIAALVQLYFGFFLDPGEFGISRWFSGCIDIVVLPAVIPLLIYLFLIGSRLLSGPVDFAHFTQLWLIPCAIIRALALNSQNDPILLILVPLLWTVISVGIPLFIKLFASSSKMTLFLASSGVIIVPLAAATSYWAFFSQRNGIGFLFLLAAALPAMVSVALSFNRK